MDYTMEEFKWKDQLIDLDLEFTYTVVPYVPGHMYARNGDPGDPPEGGYCEDVFGRVLCAIFYNEDGTDIAHLNSTEDLKDIQKAFDDFFDKDEKFQDTINELCYLEFEQNACDEPDFDWGPDEDI